MKKEKKIIRSIVTSMSLLTISFGIISCNNQPKTEDSKEVAEEHNEAKFDNNAKEKDAKFLVNAAEINLEEIRLGELAQTQGSSADVKELGKMMKEEHSKTFDELKTLAASKSITIPTTLTEDGHDEYKDLVDKKGTDFDKKFAELMVDGHKDAIKKFEDATKDTEDADIKNWADKTLPGLRHHLDKSLTVKERFK